MITMSVCSSVARKTKPRRLAYSVMETALSIRTLCNQQKCGVYVPFEPYPTYQQRVQSTAPLDYDCEPKISTVPIRHHQSINQFLSSFLFISRTKLTSSVSSVATGSRRMLRMGFLLRWCCLVWLSTSLFSSSSSLWEGRKGDERWWASPLSER